MGGLRRTGHLQNRVSPTERIGHGLFGQWIGDPLTVHDEAVLVRAGSQGSLLQPATAPYGKESLGVGLPMVKASRDANADGRGMREFKVNWNQLRAGAPGVVMVMIVFHSCKFDWMLRWNSSTHHFCHDEDDDGSQKASSSEEIYEGIANGGKQGG